jgi:hypothetical protein
MAREDRLLPAVSGTAIASIDISKAFARERSESLCDGLILHRRDLPLRSLLKRRVHPYEGTLAPSKPDAT